jgi:hypothetical protein
MAKLQLEGEFIEVLAIEEVGENRTKKQSVVIKVDGFKDEWSGKEGRAEYWKLDAMGDKIDQLKMSSDLEGKKALFRIFINSNLVVKADGSNIYPINAALASFELKSK